MAYGISDGHVTDDVTWPPKVLWVRSAILATAWLLVQIHIWCYVIEETADVKLPAEFPNQQYPNLQM